MTLFNGASFFGQNNSRFIQCKISPAPDWAGVVVNGSDSANPWGTLNINVALFVDHSFTTSLNCVALTGGNDQSYVWVDSVRLNAVAVDNLQSQ